MRVNDFSPVSRHDSDYYDDDVNNLNRSRFEFQEALNIVYGDYQAYTHNMFDDLLVCEAEDLAGIFECDTEDDDPIDCNHCRDRGCGRCLL